MIDASFKKYNSFQDFITDALLTVMREGIAAIVCNYADYSGLIAALNEKTINNQSLFLDAECMDSFDDDLVTAQMNDGNMLITILDTGRIVGEPIIFQKFESFETMTYFVEYDAKSAVDYLSAGTIVPFQIMKEILRTFANK